MITRKQLEKHFEIINTYPVSLVVEEIIAEINELKEAQCAINALDIQPPK